MIRFKEYTCLLVIAAAVWVGIALWQRHSMAYGFDLIGPEDPLEKVVWVMGKPSSIDDSLSLDGGACARDYNYLPPLAWCGGVGWFFRFDRNDRVVEKGIFNYD